MSTVDFVNQILAVATIGGQIAIAAIVVYVVFFRKSYHIITDFFAKHGVLLAFIVALASTAGSLFYSEIAGFEPCDLCWYQRVFMYPLVVLLFLKLIKKEKKVIDCLVLSVTGFFISLYQNYIYYNNEGLDALCNFGGSGTSCLKRYIFEFGYVTIPLMSLTAFILVVIFLLFVKLNNQDGKKLSL